jgi:hypothetical protein
MGFLLGLGELKVEGRIGYIDYGQFEPVGGCGINDVPIHRYYIHFLRCFVNCKIPVPPSAEFCRPAEFRRPFDMLAFTTMRQEKEKTARGGSGGPFKDWLPFVHMFRTLCVVPKPEIRLVLAHNRNLMLEGPPTTGSRVPPTGFSEIAVRRCG